MKSQENPSQNPKLPKGYKQTEVGVLPEDWVVRKLGDISYMKGRIGWQGLNETEFNFNYDDPFLITGMNFKEGKIKWKDVYHVPHIRYGMAKDIQLKTNDILMTKDGTIGKILYVDDIPYPHMATLNSHLLLFRPLKISYYPKFLYFQFYSKYFRNNIELYKSGSTFFGISQESVAKFPNPFPPLSQNKKKSLKSSLIQMPISKN